MTELLSPTDSTEIFPAANARRSQAATPLRGMLAASLLSAPGIATEIAPRTDLSAVLRGTTVHPGIQIEGARPLWQKPPLMRQLLELSGLSRRRWADILGVSHTTVANWERSDPQGVAPLVEARDLLERARLYHADVHVWLTAWLPGMSTRPVDLLAAGSYRALRGALRAGAGAGAIPSREQRVARLKEDMTWPVPEVAPRGDERS